MTSALLLSQAAWQAGIDPLLPVPVAPPDGEPLTAALAAGERVAGVLTSTVLSPGDLPTLWSAMRTQELHPLIGAHGAAGLDGLLRQWRALLDGVPDAGDSACLVHWPSRDVAATAVLLRHGMVPLTVLAVRDGRAPAPPPPMTGVTVRRAGPRDIDVLVGLALAELEFSAQVGNAVVRPDAASIKRAAISRHFDAGDPVLLAERDGVAVGHLECWVTDSTPGSWAETRLPHGRWGYVNCLSVAPGARGGGIGRTLASAASAWFSSHGARGAFLYFNPPNPLSSVFWPRQGFRPLWTIWEARPAVVLR